MIDVTYVTRVRCDHDTGDGKPPCPARLHFDDPDLPAERVLVAVAEHGWGTDPLRCPRHRGDG